MLTIKFKIILKVIKKTKLVFFFSTFVIYLYMLAVIEASVTLTVKGKSKSIISTGSYNI